jgi:hypothetical protein
MVIPRLLAGLPLLALLACGAAAPSPLHPTEPNGTSDNHRAANTRAPTGAGLE